MTSSALITGATGFIGGKLAARLLGEGYTVHALLRSASHAGGLPPGVRVHRHDETVAGLIPVLNECRPDIVFHLASLYLSDHRSDQVDDLVASNILFPARLAEAMAATGIRRLVNTGTAWQHYRSDAYDPVNLYAATKQACLDLLAYYADACGLSVITLELFDTYGRGDKRRKLVQLIVDAADSGIPLGMSPGEQVIDLTHVDDVVDAFLAAARRLATEPVLFETFRLSGERFAVRDLVRAIELALGRPVPVEFGARSYRDREVMMPVAAGNPLPGWRHTRPLHDNVASLSKVAAR